MTAPPPAPSSAEATLAAVRRALTLDERSGVVLAAVREALDGCKSAQVRCKSEQVTHTTEGTR